MGEVFNILDTPTPVPIGTAPDRTMDQFRLPTCTVTRAGTGNIVINKKDWPTYKKEGYTLAAGETASMASESTGLEGGHSDSEEAGDTGEEGKVEGDPVNPTPEG